MNIDLNFFKDSRTYCNKLWQAVRYVNMCTKAHNPTGDIKLLDINQVSYSS